MAEQILQDLIPALKLIIAPYATIELVVFALMVGVSIFLFGRRGLSRRKEHGVPSLADARTKPGVSVVIPAYNEAQTIVDSLETVVSQSYKDLEVIVVNDASKDRTLDILTRHFKLFPDSMQPKEVLSSTAVLSTLRSHRHPNLKVINKAYSGKGKGDALNVGMAYAEKKLLCVLDADSILHHDSVAKLAQPFADDKRVVAAGGAIRAGNGRSVEEILSGSAPKLKNPLVFSQMMEYARIFFVDRVCFSFLNTNVIISGAFGMFDRDAMFAVGGYQCGNLAEDMALTMRLHRHCLEAKRPYRIVHVTDAQCWTEVPYNLKLLYRQRTRWHAGYVQSAIENLDLLFKPSHGLYSNFALPYCLALALEPLVVVVSLCLLYHFAVLIKSGMASFVAEIILTLIRVSEVEPTRLSAPFSSTRSRDI